MMKSITLIKAAIAMLVMLAFAPTMTSTPKVAPAKPKLQVVWFCAGLERAITELVKKYPDADVQMRCVPLDQWHDQIFNDFANHGGADLVVLDSQFIGEAVVGQHVIELTDWIKNTLEVGDYVPAALSAYGEYPPGSGRFYGIPLLADAQMLVYRRDLYTDPAIQADYKAKTGRDLAVPKTWTELLSQAQFFKNSRWVRHGYSAHWKGKNGYDEISTQWNQILWSFGGELWDSTTYQVEGVLNSSEGVRALEFAAELFKTSPDGAANFSFAEMVEALCDGSTAIGNIWFALGPEFLNQSRCRCSDKLGFGVVPGEVKHVISLGGQGISISAYTKNREAALAFLQWLESRETQLEWVKLGGASARRSVLGSDTFLSATPYNRYFPESFELVKDFWNLPEYASMLAIEQEYLSLAVTGQMSAKQALDTIAQKQQEILDQAYMTHPKSQIR